MGFLDIFRRRKPVPEERGTQFGFLSFGSGMTYSESHAMSLSTVFRCVNVISDSVAMLPVHVFKNDKNGFLRRDLANPLQNLLDREPNARMSRFMFFKQIVCSVLLDGNAFVYIHRDDSGKPMNLYWIPSEFVTIVPPVYLSDAPIYKVTGMREPVHPEDMIHVIQYTDDGYTGVSVLTHARNTLALAHSELGMAKDFFESGCACYGLLKASDPLGQKAEAELRKSWEQSRAAGGSSKGVVILPSGIEYQQIQISPQDSQLLASRTFSISELCRFFACPPSKVFEKSSVSYSSLEMDTLLFLSDCLQPILTKIEQEFERKLTQPGTRIKFQTETLITLDMKSKAEYYRLLTQQGIMTINEARLQLGLDAIGESGDVNWVPVNQMASDKAMNNEPTDDKITTNENE